MQHVAAHRKIERAIGRVQAEDRLMFESNPSAEPRMPAARERQVRVDDVHAEHQRFRKQIGEP